MAAISGLGAITSVDTFVERFLQAERQPVKRLETQKTLLQKQIAVFSDLKSELAVLRKRVKDFLSVGAEAKLGAKIAVSSNESIVTAEATADAEIGVNTLYISRIASRDTAISDRISKKTTTLASRFHNTTQRFTVQIGDNAPVEIAISFNDRKEKNTDVLNRIANSINGASLGVTASVIEVDRNSVRLAIVSTDTGSSQAITFENGAGGTMLNRIGLLGLNGERNKATNIQGGFLIENVDDLDSVFTLNGVEITQNSNKITNVVKGLTFNLLKAHENGDQPETITVSGDNDQLKEEIKGFIEDYNKVLKYINAKTKNDIVKNERGALAGNFNVLHLRMRLREIISNNISGEENSTIKNLTQLGIEIDRNGLLSIEDEELFDKRLTENQSEIQTLFKSDSGLAQKLETELTKFTRFGGVIGNIERGIRNRIRSIDQRTKRFNERLRGRETSLKQRFARLQRVLGALTSQQRTIQQFGIQFPGTSFGFGNQQFTSILG